jgi:hypothetical protein
VIETRREVNWNRVVYGPDYIPGPIVIQEEKKRKISAKRTSPAYCVVAVSMVYCMKTRTDYNREER